MAYRAFHGLILARTQGLRSVPSPHPVRPLDAQPALAERRKKALNQTSICLPVTGTGGFKLLRASPDRATSGAKATSDGFWGLPIFVQRYDLFGLSHIYEEHCPHADGILTVIWAHNFLLGISRKTGTQTLGVLMNIPPIHGYWDSPTPSDIGDSDADRLFMHVGIALSQWEQTEESFCLLLRLFIGINNSRASAVVEQIYGSIVAGGGRANALEAAGKVFLDGNSLMQKHMPTFTLLINHFRKAGARRNEIAHGKVTKYRINDVDHGMFLVSANYNANKTNPIGTLTFWEDLNLDSEPFASLPSKYRYTTSDLVSFISRFRDLRNWALDFHSEASAEWTAY